MTRAEALKTASQFYWTLAAAMLEGSKVELRYGFTSQARFSDLAGIERSLNRLLREVLRDLSGTKRLPRRMFHLDPAKMVHRDDGDHSVTVTLDFAALIPGERDGKTLDAARAIREQLTRPATGGDGRE